VNGLAGFLGYFAFICAAVALACSLIRERDWRRIARETWHFFAMMVVGILVFSVIVYLLEWAFVRPL
jgi:hypothetical protein